MRYMLKMNVTGKAKVGGQIVEYTFTKFYNDESITPMLEDVIKLKGSSNQCCFDFYVHDDLEKRSDLKRRIEVSLNDEAILLNLESAESTREPFSFKKPSLKRTLNPIFYSVQNRNKDYLENRI